MYQDIDFKNVSKRYEEFWAKENHQRPLLHVTAPKGSTANLKPSKLTLEEKWLNTDYIIKSNREKFAHTYYAGESYPLLCPNYGPDFFGAVLGSEIVFGEDTSWAHPGPNPFSEREAFRFDPNSNLWWQRMEKLVEALVEDAKTGDYFVGITDMHGGLDGLVSLRGPEELCFDLYDEPDEVKRRTQEAFGFYQDMMKRLFAMTGKHQKGSSHWMSAWHPGNWFNVSCDFMCMLSEEMFDEFVLPVVLQEIALYDASIFHLDGPGALKHLDKLLEIDSLTGIQWVYGAGNPTAAHWIPILKKIQAAGKVIHIDITWEDLDPLLAELKPEGLMLCASLPTEEAAREMLKKAEASYQKKLF